MDGGVHWRSPASLFFGHERQGRVRHLRAASGQLYPRSMARAVRHADAEGHRGRSADANGVVHIQGRAEHSLIWLHRYATTLACATLLLVAAGGMVTSTSSGLS